MGSRTGPQRKAEKGPSSQVRTHSGPRSGHVQRPQLRVFLHALINLDPYSFTDDVAQHFAAEDQDHNTTSEEILLAAVNALADDKLTGFALRLVLTGNLPIPNDGEVDLLTEAEAAFVPAKPKKTVPKKSKEPGPTEADKSATKKTTSKKQPAF